MTTFTNQSKQAIASFSTQAKNATSFTLQSRDLGESLLLKEDGDYLEKEDGFGIILEQATQGDMWVLQTKL